MGLEKSYILLILITLSILNLLNPIMGFIKTEDKGTVSNIMSQTVYVVFTRNFLERDYNGGKN